jgi:hypothetical protein
VKSIRSCMIGNKHRQTHGLSKSPEYYIWRSMKARCYNPKSASYCRYGKRGIKVCKRWLNSFEIFYKDIGPRSTPAHQIDRINNNGNYTPKNCRWVTATENGNNRITSKKITFRGKTLTASEWAKRLGLTDRGAITRRLARGWSIEAAITTPKVPRKFRTRMNHLITS